MANYFTKKKRHIRDIDRLENQPTLGKQGVNAVKSEAIPGNSSAGKNAYTGTRAASVAAASVTAPKPSNTAQAGSREQSDIPHASGSTTLQGNATEGGYPEGSFEDYYNRLVTTLAGYGVALNLPSLDDLYAQLEASLRPAVDAAIDRRQQYGEQTMAELDADAYSRGMGGSSYLSSMKEREYDDIASDIAMLESNYSSEIAEYLYNAASELNKMQAQFAQMELQQRYERQLMLEANRLSAQNGGGSGSGGGKGGTKGPSSDSDDTEADQSNMNPYDMYSIYIQCLSGIDRNSLFYSNDAYWKELRDEMRALLTPAEYDLLHRTYVNKGSNSRGSIGNGRGMGGGSNWAHTLA